MTICVFLVSLTGFAQPATKKQDILIAGIPYTLLWHNDPLSYKVNGNTLSITAGKETDLYCFVDGNYYSNTAPKILFVPDSNFILSVKIKPAFQNMYDGGAIVLYSDNNNWAKLLFEKHEDGSRGLGCSLVTDKRGDDSYHTMITANEVYVKLAKSGNIFNFYYAQEGGHWKLLRTFPYQQKDIKIGFYAQSPKGESCTVEFSDIRYKGEKFKDYFTGE